MGDDLKEYVSKEAKKFRLKKEDEWKKGLIAKEDFWIIKRMRRMFNDRTRNNRTKRDA